MTEQLFGCCVCHDVPLGKLNLVLNHYLTGLAPWCLSSHGSALLITLKEHVTDSSDKSLIACRSASKSRKKKLIKILTSNNKKRQMNKLDFYISLNETILVL